MLASLPTEILNQIIESAIPRSFHSDTYHTRQETLCTLSLVSRRFHAIAHPLLCEVAWIKDWQQFGAFLESTAGGGQGHAAKNRSTVLAVINSDWKPGFSRHLSIGPQLGQLVSIRHLTLSRLWAETVDWDLLASLPNLISLTVSQLEWDETDRIAPLPNLERLAVVFLSESTQLAFFDPANVPNLRHLAIVEDQIGRPALAALKNLLSRLETIQLDSSIWRQLDSAWRGDVIDRTLLDASLGDLDVYLRVEAKHVRIQDDAADLARHLLAANRVRVFAHSIAVTTTGNIETLYLDPSVSKLELTSPNLFSAFRQLESTCRERKVDVVYEEGPSHHYVEPCISLDFIKRQKAARERRKENE